ncbi:hypothetical protein C8J57DRAFT_1230504 [Mycena rebaudengoi]|nr:hypothetical protein C8J57DRAFT_1230504 [Mycena rebaudengoi]
MDGKDGTDGMAIDAQDGTGTDDGSTSTTHQGGENAGSMKRGTPETVSEEKQSVRDGWTLHEGMKIPIHRSVVNDEEDRWPVESLKKFLTGRDGQQDGRDGSMEFDTKAVLRLWDLRSTHNIVNTFPLTETDMMQMTREKDASPKLSRIDKRNSDIRVRRLPKSQQID